MERPYGNYCSKQEVGRRDHTLAAITCNNDTDMAVAVPVGPCQASSARQRKHVLQPVHTIMM